MAEAVVVQPAEGHASEAPAPAIRASGLVREYGELVALDGVAFDLEAGQTLAVLGPNGAGKTTLVRILATLLRPTAGEVSVLGCELPRQAWRAKGRIGLVPARPLLYRDLTVAENLGFCAALHGIEEPGVRIAELLAAVGLERRTGELVRNLSEGMAQRAAVCRAVLHEPELLLLDEPLSHLDPDASALVEPLIGGEAGPTRVLVSHDVQAALAESDRALLIDSRGRARYEGPSSGLSAGDALAAYGGRIP